ncbi:MAG: transposase [Phycisphaerales bacterium]
MQLARTRLASSASPVLRMMAERDHALHKLAVRERELEIFWGQRETMPPHRRPDYSPEQRLAIIQLMRLEEWNVAVIAKRFVLHPNTVREWIKAVEGRGNTRLLSSAVVWNRIDDLVRWATHELRQLCPEPEFGTRTIARHLLRAGIAIRRTTVQRVLRERTPVKPRPRRPKPVAVGIESHHLLTPTQTNEVWHMDMTMLRVLWMQFTVAAIIDGFTRRLLALRVYGRTPRADQMAALVRRATADHGKAHFIITDHGCQFRKRFGAAMKKMGIHHVRSRVRQPFLNGKIERFFRSFKMWWRFTLPAITVRGLQKKLDNFRGWYNEHRVHAALGGCTPNEVSDGAPLKMAVPIRQGDQLTPQIDVQRLHCRGDPKLPIVSVTLQLSRAA